MVRKVSACLSIFGIRVGELTSNSQMTKQQVSEMQIVFTMPEKWLARVLTQF
jgi:replicative superfamily II helicase